MKSERFRKCRVRYEARNINGTLYMRTSHSLFVAGKIRKNFSTLSGELGNGSAFHFNNKSEKEHKIHLNWFNNDEKLFEKAFSVGGLKKAWFALRGKPGLPKVESYLTERGDINDYWITTTSRKLLEGSFKYPSSRKVLQNKPGNVKSPSIIVTLKIRIIEKAILNAIEPLLEGNFRWLEITKKDFDSEKARASDERNYRVVKIFDECVYQKKKVINPAIFSPHSYGFRPHKSAHQALKVLKHWRTDTSFLIDYGVSKSFCTVNRKRLKSFFYKRVFDVRFWLEISKILNFRVVTEPEQLFKRKGVGQTNFISPFLFNVYMHELDQKIASFQKTNLEIYKSDERLSFETKEAQIDYSQFSRDFFRGNLKKSLKKCNFKEIILKKSKFLHKIYHKKYGLRKNIGIDLRCIQYVRYADAFLVGVVGSREYAVQVRKDINNFLKSTLHLKVNKDNLIYRNDNGVFFLDHIVCSSEFKVKISSRSKQIRAVNKNKNKSVLRTLESDKRLATIKSHQLHLKVLLQFSIVSEKLKINLKDKKHINNLSLFFAYRRIGLVIMKDLGLTNWDEFLELLALVDSPDSSTNKSKNPAIRRWISYLSEEVNRLTKSNSIILRDKLSSLVKLNHSDDMFEKIVDKSKEAQLNYLKNSYSFAQILSISAIENSPKSFIEKFNTNIRLRCSLSKQAKNSVSVANKLTMSSLKKSTLRRITVNAPIRVIFVKLRVNGYIHSVKARARGMRNFGFYTDIEIVYHFNSAIRGLLNRFSGTNNFSKVKSLAQLLRNSCILTLANKHNKSQNWVYTIYGSEISVNKGKKGKKALLISRLEILNYSNKFNLKKDSFIEDSFELENRRGLIFQI